jgi:hypothetical protein
VKPVDPKAKLTAGSHFLEKSRAPVAANDGGWLTSKVYSRIWAAISRLAI